MHFVCAAYKAFSSASFSVMLRENYMTFNLKKFLKFVYLLLYCNGSNLCIPDSVSLAQCNLVVQLFVFR